MASKDWLFQSRALSKLVGRSGALRKFAMSQYEHSFANGQISGTFRGVYDTFDEAARSAPAVKTLGYDQPDAGAMYRDRMVRVYPADYPMLFWLKVVQSEVRTVFDFGGHVGVARYAFDPYLQFSSDLSWTVCDVPAVAEAGRQLAAERVINGLTFTTEPERAAGVDLFFSSGALQYLDWSLPELFARIERPKRVLLNMLPITDRKTYFTLQNIGTAFCPYRIINRQELFGGLERLGYRQRDGWTNPDKSCGIPFHLEHSLTNYEGAYFTLDA